MTVANSVHVQCDFAKLRERRFQIVDYLGRDQVIAPQWRAFSVEKFFWFG